jgi:signal transduction histidine kinase
MAPSHDANVVGRTDLQRLAGGPPGSDAPGAAEPTARLRGLCHDLRQYVSAALLLSEMPEDHALDATTAERLRFIRQALLHAEEMIDTTQRDLSPRAWPFDLTSLVEHTVPLLQSATDAAIDLRLGPRSWAIGDPALVRRALVNLVDNASRAVGSGSCVLVAVGSDDTTAWIEVADDGPGFGQIGAGSGVGMTIVQAAVEVSDGRLDVSSSSSGTTVRISLPKHDRDGP